MLTKLDDLYTWATVAFVLDLSILNNNFSGNKKI